MATGGTGKRALWALIALALVAVAVVVWLPDDAPTERPSTSSKTPADEPGTPGLLGAQAERPTADPAEPAPKRAAPEEAPAKRGTWILTFEVTGAPRWWFAVFEPSTDGVRPVVAYNPPDGGPRGRLDVPGAGRLVVRAKGRVPFTTDVLTPPADGERHVECPMDEGLAISGVVVAADGSTPVRKGQVRVRSALGPDGLPETKLGRSWVSLDDHGRFVITGLSPGPVELSTFPYDKALGAAVTFKTTAGTQNVRLRLDPMGVLRVRISDATTGKAPRTGAIQIDYPGPSGQRAMSTRSGGSFGGRPPIVMTLPNALRGKPGTIRVRAKGYAFFEAPFELPADGGLQELDVRLEPGHGDAALLVIALEVEGVPNPEVVSVMRYTGEHGTGAPEDVDAGRLELRLAPGTTALMIGPLDRTTFFVPVRVELDKAATRAGARLERRVRLVRGGHLRFARRPPTLTVKLQQGTTELERQLVRPRGRPAFVVLPAGRWSFRIEGKHETWFGEADIRAGKVTDATWEVERRAK